MKEGEDHTVGGQLIATDPDAGNTATWNVVNDGHGTYGALVVDPETGHWTYTLDNDAAQSLKVGEVVRETFTVKATDEAGASTSQLVSIDITGTNDAPQVAQSSNLMGSMKEDTSLTFSVDDLLKGAQITDIDRDALQITNVALDTSSAPGTLVDSYNGTWTYTPGQNVSNITPQFVFSVSDGHQTVSAHAGVTVQPVADPADVSITAGTVRDVINTGSADDLGRIVVPNLTTKALSAFTLEFIVLGKSVPESTTGAGPVIVNIGSPPSDKNTLTLWDPANMKVGMSKTGGGDVNIATGIDLTDGDSHRITLTWDSTSNSLKVYDNGELALTTTPPKAFPATLYMAIAEKANTPPTTANPSGGGYRTNEHFEGTIFNVAMADKAETAAQVKAAPLAEQLQSNLLIDVRAEDGKIVDTTGKHTIGTVGGLHEDTLPVDSGLASVPAGSTLHVDVSTRLGDPQDTVTHLEIAGFVAGTVLSDGSHSVTVSDSTQKIDVTDWSLENLTAKLPDGVHQNMDLTVSATVSTPPYATGEVDANGQPVLTSDSTVVVEDHQIYVEGATAAAPTMAPATMMRSFAAAPLASSAASSSDTDTAAVPDHDTAAQSTTDDTPAAATHSDQTQAAEVTHTTSALDDDLAAKTTDSDQAAASTTTGEQPLDSTEPADTQQADTGPGASADADTASQSPDQADASNADPVQHYQELATELQTNITEATSSQDGSPVTAEADTQTAQGTESTDVSDGLTTPVPAADDYMALAQSQDGSQTQQVQQSADQRPESTDYTALAANPPAESDQQERPPPDQIQAATSADPIAPDAPAQSTQHDDVQAGMDFLPNEPTPADQQHLGT